MNIQGPRLGPTQGAGLLCSPQPTSTALFYLYSGSFMCISGESKGDAAGAIKVNLRETCILLCSPQPTGTTRKVKFTGLTQTLGQL